MRKILPLLLILCLVMTGCRSHKNTARKHRHNKPDTTQVVTPTNPDTNSGSGNTNTTPSTTKPTTPTKPTYTPHYYTCNFTAEAQGIKANGQMRLQSDSTIWICATKIVELGRAKFTPDSAIVYVKLMNRCFRGTYDDLYHRFRYRTTFKQLYHHVTAPDAEKQLTDLFKRFGIEATIKMDPLKEVGKQNFPLVIPKNTNQF